MVEIDRDDELVAQLRRVANEVDPVPEAVVAAARAAIATRDLDAELAVLIADSAARDADDLSHPSLAFEPTRRGTTGLSGGRLLSFSGGGLQVDLEVSERGELRDLIGQLAGPPATGCTMEHPGGQWPIPLDDLGRFTVTGVKPGPIRLRCLSERGFVVTTAWVAI